MAGHFLDSFYAATLQPGDGLQSRLLLMLRYLESVAAGATRHCFSLCSRWVKRSHTHGHTTNAKHSLLSLSSTRSRISRHHELDVPAPPRRAKLAVHPQHLLSTFGHSSGPPVGSRGAGMGLSGRVLVRAPGELRDRQHKQAGSWKSLLILSLASEALTSRGTAAAGGHDGSHAAQQDTHGAGDKDGCQPRRKSPASPPSCIPFYCRAIAEGAGQ